MGTVIDAVLIEQVDVIGAQAPRTSTASRTGSAGCPRRWPLSRRSSRTVRSRTLALPEARCGEQLLVGWPVRPSRVGQ
jgi:hypothetical protein